MPRTFDQLEFDRAQIAKTITAFEKPPNPYQVANLQLLVLLLISDCLICLVLRRS